MIEEDHNYNMMNLTSESLFGIIWVENPPPSPFCKWGIKSVYSPNLHIDRGNCKGYLAVFGNSAVWNVLQCNRIYKNISQGDASKSHKACKISGEAFDLKSPLFWFK